MTGPLSLAELYHNISAPVCQELFCTRSCFALAALVRRGFEFYHFSRRLSRTFSALPCAFRSRRSRKLVYNNTPFSSCQAFYRSFLRIFLLFFTCKKWPQNIVIFLRFSSPSWYKRAGCKRSCSRPFSIFGLIYSSERTLPVRSRSQQQAFPCRCLRF